MARYYFDFNDGETMMVDEGGIELDGVEAVHREALKALADVAKEFIPKGGQRSIVVGVRDEAGQRVLMAALSLNVQQMA